MKAVAAALALTMLQAACVVVPTGHAPGPGHVESRTIDSLKAMNLSRAEVLMMLGDPDDRYLGDVVFGYRWTESLATVIFGAGYQVGGFDITEKRRLMIEFSQGGSMRRVDVLGAVSKSKLEEALTAWLAQGRDGGR